MAALDSYTDYAISTTGRTGLLTTTSTPETPTYIWVSIVAGGTKATTVTVECSAEASPAVGTDAHWAIVQTVAAVGTWYRCEIPPKCAAAVNNVGGSPSCTVRVSGRRAAY